MNRNTEYLDFIAGKHFRAMDAGFEHACAQVEPSAVIIPAGQDCQHLNVCHYAIAHGCIQPQLRDREFRCAIARAYEEAA